MPCLPSLTASKVDSRPQAGVGCEPLDALVFLLKDLVAMNQVCQRVESRVPASKVLHNQSARQYSDGYGSK